MTQETLEFEIVKRVTLPQLKLEVGKEFYLKFLSPIEDTDLEPAAETKKRVKKDAQGNPIPAPVRDMAPPLIAKVVNMLTKTECQIVVGAVLESILEESYPDDAYVGKIFRIVMGEKAQGKKYRPYEVTEMAVKGTVQPDAKKK